MSVSSFVHASSYLLHSDTALPFWRQRRSKRFFLELSEYLRNVGKEKDNRKS